MVLYLVCSILHATDKLIWSKLPSPIGFFFNGHVRRKANKNAMYIFLAHVVDKLRVSFPFVFNLSNRYMLLSNNKPYYELNKV